MAEYDYHNDTSRINAGMINMAESKTLAHVKHAFFDEGEKKETIALRFGSMFHAAILEQEEFDNRYKVVADSIKFNTKEGKTLKAEIEASGKTVIKEKDFKDAKAMADSLLKELKKNNIDINKGIWEQPVITDTRRCKPDVLIDNVDHLLCVDLKTCVDASPMGFERSAYRLGYHVIAAWYTKVLEQAFQKPVVFVFACVEKSAPYVAQCYTASDLLIKAGEQICVEQEAAILNAIETDNWPAYFEGMGVIDLPEWAAGELINFDDNQGE